jgi:hypothetical protein
VRGIHLFRCSDRSPFGSGFGPNARLYLLNDAMDDEGVYAAAHVPDALFAIREGDR